jgi:DNA-binding transcriptional LysR family regulator
VNDLRSIDLNLLVVLEALLEERHVSRAAEKLHLTQPAASSALSRCRRLFEDRLLERVEGQMQPTPKGLELQRRLRPVLANVHKLIDRSPPRVEDLRQEIRLITADHMASRIGRALYSPLATAAPGLTLVLQPWSGAVAALDALARGSADLAVSVFTQLPDAFHKATLLQETWKVLRRKDHPARTLTLDSWLAYPHILMSGSGELRAPLDERLAGLGLSRRVGVVVPSFLMVPSIVAVTDLFGMLPSRCLPERLEKIFCVEPPPLVIPDFPLHLAWHSRCENDVAVRFVRELLLSFRL